MKSQASLEKEQKDLFWVCFWLLIVITAWLFILSAAIIVPDKGITIAQATEIVNKAYDDDSIIRESEKLEALFKHLNLSYKAYHIEEKNGYEIK